MELNGALSNPRVQVELKRLGTTRDRLATRAKKAPRHARPLTMRQGVVLETVTLVLEHAEGPMRARAIHRRAEQLLGQGVRWPSVREAVSAHTIGLDRRFRRLERGMYELSKDSRG